MIRYCILDDEPAFLELAKKHLTTFLPQVSGAFVSDPREATGLAAVNPRMLYIIDIRLGDSNGIDIYHEIERVAPHSRVIFVTGDTVYLDDTDLRQRALSHGGIDFIEKPVKWHELALKVKNHLKLLEYQFELEEKVEERTNMLIHADRLATVGTMVSSIVHEINTPLTSIKMNLEMAQMTSNQGEGYAKMAPLIEDSLRGVRQIEDLLKSFRRFYKQEKTLTAVELLPVIEDVRTLVIYNLRRHRIQFQVENRLPEPLSVWGNRQELIQAVTNIVNNAIDAFEGTATQQRLLIIRLEYANDSISLTVANNGPQIPEGVAAKIFEPFFTTKSDERGTGLGLSIVRQIMRGMGGDVVLRNKENGSDFVEFVCVMPVYRERRKTRLPQ